MIRVFSKNMLLPSFIGSAVLMLALTLLTIVARSPYTHSNLGIDPHYTRTEQMMVGVPIPSGRERLAVPPASDPAALGKQLFVAENCASCHGLDGGGGIVGPSILGMKAKKLRTMTHVGPGGMPAYADGALSDEDLAAIAAYLNSSNK